MKQFMVNLIDKLWPIMPRRFRLWAFLNDEIGDDLEHDADGVECGGCANEW